MATGANPIVPGITGIHRGSVMSAVDLLKGKKTAGDRVVIVGGGLIGCEVAIWLADKGRQTIIVEIHKGDVT